MQTKLHIFNKLISSAKNIIFAFIFVFSFYSVQITEAQSLITGSTTWGTEIYPVDADYQFQLSKLTGEKALEFKAVTLDGRNNQIKIDLDFLSSEINLNTGGGELRANLQIMEIFVGSKGTSSEFSYIGFTVGKNNQLKFEIYFPPGLSAITGSTAANHQHMADSRYKLEVFQHDRKVLEFGSLETNRLSTLPAPFVNSQDLDSYLGTYFRGNVTQQVNYFLVKKGDKYLSNFIYGSNEYNKLVKTKKTYQDKEYHYYTEEYSPDITLYYHFGNDKILIWDGDDYVVEFSKQPSVSSTDFPSKFIGTYYLETEDQWFPEPIKIFIKDNKIYVRSEQGESDLILSENKCGLKYINYTGRDRKDCLDFRIGSDGKPYILFEYYCKCSDGGDPTKWTIGGEDELYD